MRHHNPLPFDDDIADYVLCSLPNFQTLLRTILTSRAFLRVFESHKSTILQEICYNYVGPQLPIALCALRIEKERKVAGASAQLDPFKQPHIGPEKYDIRTLTLEEILRLVDNAKIVHKLEVFFSFSYKDPNSPMSTLTRKESLRFHAGVYRYALFTQLFPLEMYKRQFTENDLERIYAIQATSLRSFAPLNSELRGVYAVYESIYELIYQALFAIRHTPCGFFAESLVALGPYEAQALEELEEQEIDARLSSLDGGPWGTTENFAEGIWITPLKGYFHYAAKEISSRTSRSHSSIIDTDYDPPVCDICGEENSSGSIWNQQNWSMLKYGHDNFESLRYPERFLPGRLCDNEFEHPLYASTFDVKPFDYSAMMNELFKHKSNTFAGEPEDWLCSLCIQKFIRENLHHWLRKIKQERFLQENANVSMLPCPHGYDCDDQKNIAHSQAYDHFCDPYGKMPSRLIIRAIGI